MEIGRLVKEYREARGLTQANLADVMARLGYAHSREWVAGIEQGRMVPSLPFLRYVEPALGLPRGHLIRQAAFRQAERWCQRMGLYLDEYVKMIQEEMTRLSHSRCSVAQMHLAYN